MKRIIISLFPLLFLLELTSMPVQVYIRELDFYITYWGVLRLSILLVVLWFRIKKIENRFGGSKIMKVCYNIIPIEIILAVMYAQYHLEVILALMVISLILKVLALYLITKIKRKLKNNKTKERAAKKINQMCVIFICGLFAVPALMARFAYQLQSPIYETKAGWDQKPGKTEEEYFEGVHLQLDEQLWVTKTLEERMEMLQEVANYEAQKLGIPQIRLQSTKLRQYVKGEYSGRNNQIQLDTQYLQNDNAKDCVECLCHEMYHALQFYVVERIDWEDLELTGSSYYEEARNWKKDFDNTQPLSYTEYYGQSIEVSARAYAAQEISNYFETSDATDTSESD